MDYSDMEVIYQKYSRLVYGFLYSHTHNAEWSEEMTQETFLKASMSISRYDASCKLSVWLCQIAKHILWQELRKKNRFKMVELTDDLPDVSISEGETFVIQQENKIELYRAIHLLSEQEREVVLYRISGELSFREIGEIMGKSENWSRTVFSVPNKKSERSLVRMNEKHNCDVIRDLLPGYIDNILSDTGNELVKNHLRECEECHKIYKEMEEGIGKDDLSASDTMVVDALKKIRKRTNRLKITIGILMGILFILLLSAALKIYVIGTPLGTGYMSIPDTAYDEETGQLTVNGKINLYSFHVSKVVWKEDENDPNVVNVIVYYAETIPFAKDKTDFSVIIPNVKGKTVYLACPEYDRREIYDWRTHHYEEVENLKKEIYSKIPELSEKTDALNCMQGVKTVEDMEGIRFNVDFIYGEDASYWWFNGMLTTDGEFIPADFEIWISLEGPHKILIHDYQTGEYTDDFSIISNRRPAA